MRVLRQLVLVGVCLSGGIVTGFAQSADAQTPLASRSLADAASQPNGLTVAERLHALEHWSRDYLAWRTWFEQWRNTREPSLFGTQKRRERPAPPAWLADSCPVPADDLASLVEGCQLFEEWRTADPAATLHSAQTITARTKQEAPARTIWWQHIHLDALWPMAQNTSGVFGLVGVHATIPLGGRTQMFLAPGAILVRVPDLSGNQQWKPATDWGFTFRVLDFTMPGLRRPGSLHVNLAKVWLFGPAETPAGFDTSMYLAGFSLTFRKATAP
jgi:hypothetical protein